MNCIRCRVVYLGEYDDPISDEYPDFLCKKCQPDGFNLCAECGELFIDTDMDWGSYDSKDGRSYCKDCGKSK